MTSTINSTERRQNGQYRKIFEGAYEQIEPFLDPANSWSGQPLEYLAFGILREHYTQVSNDEINLLFSAAKRVFTERCQKHH